MSISEMDMKVSTYFDLMQQIEELQAEAEAIKDAVKAAMVEIEQEEITGHGWRATWHNTTTTRLDTTAFKKAHPDMFTAFAKTTTSTRFTLNPIKA